MVNVLVSIPTFFVFFVFCFVFFFVVVFCFSHLRGASGMVNVLVSIPRSLWGQETLSLLEYSPRLTFIEKATILARIYIFFKTWTAEQSWREGWRPRAQRTSCRRTCGCLGRTGGSRKDELLAWREEMLELLSKAHDTYIFFLGFHPSFWQEHFGVVDKLKRRWKHVKLSMSISKFAHLRTANCWSSILLPTSGLCCMVIWQRTATVPVGRICPPTSRSCSRTLKKGKLLFPLFSSLSKRFLISIC